MATIERVDTISFFDIDFKGESFSDSQITHLQQWSDAESPSTLQFKNSLRWVFQWSNGDETCLRGMDRVDLSKLYKNSGLRASLLFSREFAVGVLCIW
jgi:hypothetical protein